MAVPTGFEWDKKGQISASNMAKKRIKNASLMAQIGHLKRKKRKKSHEIVAQMERQRYDKGNN
ncbi:hypothetical protein QY12_15905 [Listeria monocytogenes]|nr:hypothetical protein [Listeria monocytogenes]EAC5780795.1 hypothetical protein [Listeria monocytogenes]EAC7514865.1 hypothetical protein [Listeria monocytogenes]EAC8479925.1 hypothetical protein [Listeria monocytogenes]EAD1309821.1 hypothetical protein [Listeria monocytogenes]